MGTFVGFNVVMNRHMRTQRMTGGEGLMAGGADECLTHVLDHHLIFIQQLGKKRKGRVGGIIEGYESGNLLFFVH